MKHSDQILVYTVHLLSKTMIANACCANAKEAVAIAEELSSRYAYVPVNLIDPEGNKTVYLDGEPCKEYTEATDETLKTDRFDRGQE